MELDRSTHRLGDLWSFGFPERGLKGRLSGHKASPQLALHSLFLEITGQVKGSQWKITMDGYFMRLSGTQEKHSLLITYVGESMVDYSVLFVSVHTYVLIHVCLTKYMSAFTDINFLCLICV